MRKPPRKKTTVANIKRGTAEATAQTSRARGSLDCSADQLDSDVTTSTRASTVIKPNGHEANAHQARFVLGLKSKLYTIGNCNGHALALAAILEEPQACMPRRRHSGNML
jgi:surface antigen